jgi:fatty acid desaturase
MTHGDQTIPLNKVQRLVPWRDLTPMMPRDGVVECLHPLPWLLGSFAFAQTRLWVPAIVCSFMFFLTALRLNHEAIHHNLGFGPKGHRLVLHLLSALMLGSNHAVAANHLHHHKHVMQPDDLEGKAGRMNGLKVLLYGPIFPIEMHIAAWTRGGLAFRRRMVIDAALNAAMFLLFIVSGWTVLGYHLAVVTIAQCLTAFFAVWITHHGCEKTNLIARTQRGWLVNLLSYNMFFHLEHHLFPGVPVKRLGVLAKRLDVAWPKIPRQAKMVVPQPVGRAK